MFRSVFPSMEEKIYNSLYAQVTILAEDISIDLSIIESYLEMLAKNPAMKEFQQTSDYEDILKHGLFYFDQIALLDSRGKTVYKYPDIQQNIPEHLDMTGLYDKFLPYDILVHEEPDHYGFSIFSPIHKKDEHIGTLKGSIDTKNGFAFFSGASLRNNGEAFLLTDSGKIISHSNSKQVGVKMGDLLDYSEQDSFPKNANHDEKMVVYIVENGDDRKAVALLPVFTDFYTGVSYDYDYLYSSIYQLKTIIIFFSIAAYMFVLAFGLFYHRKISNPLVKLVTYAEKIANGNFNIDSSVPNVGEVSYIMKAIHNVLGKTDEIYEEMIQTLINTMEKKDGYTAGHSNRVSCYSMEIAQFLPLTKKELKVLKLGTLLHDLGKIGIPDGVLQKPGALTNEEYDLIKKHPVFGFEIIKQNHLFHEALPIIRSHHERFDGKGYPDQLKGEDIPFLARIASVADAFDAITSKRSYRDAIPEQKAIEIIVEEAGKQFDPIVVDAFLKWQNKKQTEKSTNYDAS
ncbi:MAG: HD domain-containing protein [Bacillus sp. (in: Bacteria)]|nr:HD domain-containing protein [Bacillus sp. (in: firmicutes)]